MAALYCGFHAIALLSHFYKSHNCGRRTTQSHKHGLDKVRILQPILIGDGVRLRSHISLLDAQPKANGDMLLKTQHDIEADGVEGKVIYAEYLTYWHGV